MLGLLVILLLLALVGIVIWAIRRHRHTPVGGRSALPIRGDAGPPCPPCPPLTDCSVEQMRIVSIQNENAVLAQQLQECKNSQTPCPMTDAPTPCPKTDAPKTPTLDFPCPILASTSELKTRIDQKTATGLGNSLSPLRSCKTVVFTPVSSSTQSPSPLGLVLSTQKNNESLLTLCLPPSGQSDPNPALSSFLTTDPTLQDLSWVFPFREANPCQNDLLLTGTLPIPLNTPTSKPLQYLYYLPFSITKEDLESYRKNNSTWFFFFVADAAATLYIDGTPIRSVYRRDTTVNVENGFVTTQTTYPGVEASPASWTPTTTGDHLLTVVLTAFLPAWRVGFALCAYQKDEKGHLSRVIAHRSAAVYPSDASGSTVAINTASVTGATSWFISSC